MTDNAGDSGRPGVVAAAQTGAAPLAVLAAPATGDEFNTIGERLVPKACFKVEDLLFDFDSSFVRPEIGAHLPQLSQLRNDNKVQDLFPPLSIFGHADPVGNDDNNKKLSGRRATAIYAMLVRDVDLWEKLFTNPLGNDKWGTRAVQTMLSTVQDAIAIDGEVGDETRGAIRKFQTAQGLSVDGSAGPNTRKALYRAYMDALCGPDLVLDKTSDFLAPQSGRRREGRLPGMQRVQSTAAVLAGRICRLRGRVRQDGAQSGKRSQPARDDSAFRRRAAGEPRRVAVSASQRRSGGLQETLLSRRRCPPQFSGLTARLRGHQGHVRLPLLPDHLGRFALRTGQAGPARRCSTASCP